MSYIDPPSRMPFLLRALLWMVERRMGRALLANRILTWYPKSFLVSCPLCIDLNSQEFQRKGITEQEIRDLQRRIAMDEVPTLTVKEKAALRYVECMCRTPVGFTAEAVENVKTHFTARGFVILASTCAQVNFWTRLIQSLGVPPAGFSSECAVLDLDSYATLKTKR